MKKLDLYKTDEKKFNTGGGSRRNERVASEIRECFSAALIREELLDIPCSILTITHVDVSPDLRNAKVFVMPLGGEKMDETLKYLNEHTHYFKNIIATKMKIRFIPEIIFKKDETLEYARKIDSILDRK
ncbi:MAG: 30S ribosome-binding factor RbfA [Holosporales bacterium]|jgi:ribosome-binding factor A|nr:30S ribosome-binding factor RbfA [Holosporales bacterium]